GAPNIAPTFRNNNVNNNNKRPNTGRDVAGDKIVKVEGRQLAENCKFCDKPGHRVEECWKKLGACLRCGGRDHHIPDCPMMKDQPGRAQNIPWRQGRLNAVIEADLPEEGGMVEGTSFRTCWGCVEEFLVARELWIDHKKLIFFPFSSAATCTNHLLGVELSTLCQHKAILDRNPMPCPFSVVLWHGPCERDGPIGRVHKAVAIEHTVMIGSRQDMSSRSACLFCSRPVATLARAYHDLTPGLTALSPSS
ncbi:hypothetical protein Taro_049532, partial [Colocasia esculenta]|nr:hypothetical protein [Colocasia esculenta]